MNVIRVSRKPLAVFALALSLLTSGCGDFSEIRKFAEISAAIEQGFPELAADLCQSCVRQYRYKFYRKVNFKLDLMSKIDALSESETPTPRQTGLPDGLAQEAVEEEGKCRVYKKLEPIARLMNKTLTDYLKTMGELAADGLTSYDKELDKLAVAVGTGNTFEESEVKAGNNIAKFLFKAVSESYRRGKLKEAIEQSNKDIQTLTNALDKYVSKNYVLELLKEKRELASLYETSIFQQQSNTSSADAVHILSTKSLWDTERNRLQTRIAGAQAYSQILDKVRKGHQEFYTRRNHLNSKEALQSALQSAKDIHNLVGEFRKAF